MLPKNLKIRDKRNRGWFYLDNEYLNGYAKIFGGIGTAIYVSLCRHADAESQSAYPSQELIAKELNIAPRTIRKYIKMFEEWGLLHIEREKAKDGKWLTNVYYLLDKSCWKSKPEAPVADGDQRQMTTPPEANDDKNQRHQLPNKDTQREGDSYKNNTITCEQSSQNEIGQLFDVFYSTVNPTINFGNKTTRAAADALIRKFGLEKSIEIAKYAVKVQGKPYAPTITTPYQLKEKMGALMIYGQQQKARLPIVAKIR